MFVEGGKPEGGDVPLHLAPAMVAHGWPKGGYFYPEQGPRLPQVGTGIGASKGSPLSMVGGQEHLPLGSL